WPHHQPPPFPQDLTRRSEWERQPAATSEEPPTWRGTMAHTAAPATSGSAYSVPPESLTMTISPPNRNTAHRKVQVSATRGGVFAGISGLHDSQSARRPALMREALSATASSTKAMSPRWGTEDRLRSRTAGVIS